MARVHGDLNGANILVDDHQNVWLIDFFHSRRHHVLCDFAKLENDLLFLWTPVADEAALRDQIALLDRLREQSELPDPLPEATAAQIPEGLVRTWETLRILRRIAARYLGLYRSSWHRAAVALRYAAHTLSFDEARPLQKQAALYAAGHHAAVCQKYLEMVDTLRVDFVPLPEGSGRLGITILPGRRDRGRSLERDLAALKGLGTSVVVSLVTDDELAEFGVSELPIALRELGIECLRLPLLDQRAGNLEEVGGAVDEIVARCRAGQTVVVHCVGGLGRSGMVAACVLVAGGLLPADAMAQVRKYRSLRAVETLIQEEFVERFATRSG
jgi:protein-tyrosine phosphatase